MPEGPRVVGVGGGHGLDATLRAARYYAGAITAVVSVADDGGSSGRLREQLGIVPPGDLRRCLLALADEDSDHVRYLVAALDHRFESDELAGHSVGNLLIASMLACDEDVQKALDEVGRLIGAVGRVIPAATEPVLLRAESSTGTVEGQTEVNHTRGITRVSLVPDDVKAPDAAVEAIAEADQVVIGPGSLYTSVLAAMAVPQIREVVSSVRAPKVYVSNLRPQKAETAGYDVADHVRALRTHGVQVDTVVADTSGIDLGDTDGLGVDLVLADFAKEDGYAHDPGRLADVLADLVG